MHGGDGFFRSTVVESMVISGVSLLLWGTTAFVESSVKKTHNLSGFVALESRNVCIGLTVNTLILFLGNILLINRETNVAAWASAFNNVSNDTRVSIFLVLVDKSFSLQHLSFAETIQCGGKPFSGLDSDSACGGSFGSRP